MLYENYKPLQTIATHFQIMLYSMGWFDQRFRKEQKITNLKNNNAYPFL